MQDLKYILCHGSGNRFIMIDTLEQPFDFAQADIFAQSACRNSATDGVLLLTRDQESGELAMRMFNTDGSEAEMCGNGIRCIARLADECYINSPQFTIYSGGKPYPIHREEELSEWVATYSVDIAIRTATEDFTLSDTDFIGEKINELDHDLTFTYLNLGNPHIIALVDEIDLDKLSQLGEKVKILKNIFPNGVNVSFMTRVDEQKIFVATYERGVGLTASCGTAMTASSTAACLLGITKFDRKIEVRNRGGLVNCICSTNSGLTTRLIGNATYDYFGDISKTGIIFSQEPISEETEAWSRLVELINEEV